MSKKKALLCVVIALVLGAALGVGMTLGFGGGKTLTATVVEEGEDGVLTDLLPSCQVIMRTNGDWRNQVGRNFNLGIEGTTKDGYTFSSEAYCADPTEGFTFTNETAGHFFKGFSTYCEIEGKVTALTGTLKGVDESKYVWKTEEPVTDGWEQEISSIRVIIAGDETYRWEYVPFCKVLTKNDDGSYDFRFTCEEPLEDVHYIAIDFSVFTQEYPAPLDSFTLTALQVEGSK